MSHLFNTQGVLANAGPHDGEAVIEKAEMSVTKETKDRPSRPKVYVQCRVKGAGMSFLHLTEDPGWKRMLARLKEAAGLDPAMEDVSKLVGKTVRVRYIWADAPDGGEIVSIKQVLLPPKRPNTPTAGKPSTKKDKKSSAPTAGRSASTKGKK